MLTRKIRKVIVTPSKNWGNNDSLLGAVMRYEEYVEAHERVYRIAQVYPNSPAAEAGLIVGDDYLLGSPQTYYTDLQGLSTYLELTIDSSLNKLDVWIYNSNSQTLRTTTIAPRRKWGGKGLLGCEFGLGVLNQLPVLPVEKFENFQHNKPQTVDIKAEQERAHTLEEELKPEDDHPPKIDRKQSHEEEQNSGISHPSSGQSGQETTQVINQSASYRMKLLKEKRAHGPSPHHNVIHNPFEPSPSHEPKHEPGSDAPAEKEKTSFTETISTQNETGDQQKQPTQADIKESHQPENKETVQIENKGASSDQAVVHQQEPAHRHEPTHKNEPEHKHQPGQEERLKEIREAPAEEKGSPKSGHKYNAEEATMKTAQHYAFFSKKLNGDYIIKSDDLFQLDKILNPHVGL